MTATQHPALLQAQLESMRSLLTDCHDYLKPVHEQFMRAEKHEEASHQIGNDLYARIGCMLSQAPEPISAPTLQAAANLASNRFEAPVVGWTAPAQDELVVYRAVNQFGGDCHFGVESLARVWAGPKGTVERVTLKPVPDLSVVEARPAQTEQQPIEGIHHSPYPAKCPVTGLPYFMHIEHPELGVIPTFGGPYDSYSIPHAEGSPDEPWHQRELVSHRYRHDRGHWVDDEFIPLRIIHKDVLSELQDSDAFLAATEVRYE